MIYFSMKRFKSLNIKLSAKHFFLLLILLLALILRFYRLNTWFLFGMDQEYEAFLVKNILTGKHFPLIGVNASDTGLYLGPIFIYFAAIPYFIFQGNPLGGAVTASSLGVITTFALYKLGKVWFSEKVGLLASFFWAISFLSVHYDRQFWNPTPISFLMIIILYSITMIHKGKNKFLILLSVAIGIALQSHLQSVIILPIIMLYLFLYRKKYSGKNLLLFLLILLIFQLPLILFEIRHNFINTKAVTNLLFSFLGFFNQAQSISIFERVSLFLNFIGRSIFIKGPVDYYTENGQCLSLLSSKGKTSILAIILVLASFIFYFYQQIVKKNNALQDRHLILSITIITLVSILIYKGPVFEYYYLFFLPVLYLLISWVVVYLIQSKVKFIISLIILVIVVNNIIIFLNAKMSYSFQDKLEAINYSKNYVDNDNFALEALGDCGRFGGYRYLFEYFGKIPGSSYMDPYFSWIYGDKKTDKFPRSIYFSLIDNREVENLPKWQSQKETLEKSVIQERQFGKIHVLVVKNE